MKWKTAVIDNLRHKLQLPSMTRFLNLLELKTWVQCFHIKFKDFYGGGGDWDFHSQCTLYTMYGDQLSTTFIDALQLLRHTVDTF